MPSCSHTRSKALYRTNLSFFKSFFLLSMAMSMRLLLALSCNRSIETLESWTLCNSTRLLKGHFGSTQTTGIIAHYKDPSLWPFHVLWKFPIATTPHIFLLNVGEYTGNPVAHTCLEQERWGGNEERDARTHDSAVAAAKAPVIWQMIAEDHKMLIGR